ncbi:hypothetical protein EVAR_64308_1 [Eumeta japonica]|uniref:Uncharacterized protein n=1 Tax=Eumeta variegata TaxID=151549 RepID=A0A4C2AB59_EUMVA|nr:hypothetical protein EVAR_64308_1 [Eumeta japonica]
MQLLAAFCLHHCTCSVQLLHLQSTIRVSMSEIKLCTSRHLVSRATRRTREKIVAHLEEIETRPPAHKGKGRRGEIEIRSASITITMDRSGRNRQRQQFNFRNRSTSKPEEIRVMAGITSSRRTRRNCDDVRHSPHDVKAEREADTQQRLNKQGAPGAPLRYDIEVLMNYPPSTDLTTTARTQVCIYRPASSFPKSKTLRDREKQ